MNFQIGDYVEVVSTRIHEHMGKRGIIIGFNPSALSSNFLDTYPGWCLAPPLRNRWGANIYWKRHQIRKIDPPEFEIEEREEEEINS